MRIQSRPSPLSTEGLGTRLRWCRAVVSFSLDDYTDTGTDASDVGDAHSMAICDDDQKNIIPLIFYEVKLESICSIEQYKELFMQANYSFTEYTLSDCIYCLTDAVTYRYYKVVFKDEKFEIPWKKTVINATVSADMLQHLSFLAQWV